MSDLSLQIAASGIAADEAELDNAANNLSNVSTPGYAAAVVNLDPLSASTSNGVGEGVIVRSATQNSSSLDDEVNLLAQGQLGDANEAASVLGLAENSFPEPSTSGLQSQLSQLWSDLSALASEPISTAAQQTVVQDASEVATTLNSTYSSLGALTSQLSNDLEGAGSTTGGYVGQANGLVNEIASLNGEILAGKNGATDVNALVDAQRAAVNQLGTLLGVRTSTAADGTTTVLSGGIELVSGTSAVDLAVTGSSAAGDLGIETASGNVLSAGGTIGALLTGVNTTVPSYQSQLSNIADSLATNMNALQSAGVSANGVPGPTAPAGAPPYAGPYLPSIFVNEGSSTSYTAGPTSASSIAVNPALAGDASLFATAGGGATAGTTTIDPSTAQAMAAIGRSATGPDDLYASLVGLVGSETASANNEQSDAQSLADSTSADVSSVEGVDTNEQTVNLLSAQQAYQAIAAVINSTTTALDALLAAV